MRSESERLPPGPPFPHGVPDQHNLIQTQFIDNRDHILGKG